MGGAFYTAELNDKIGKVTKWRYTVLWAPLDIRYWASRLKRRKTRMQILKDHKAPEEDGINVALLKYIG